MNRHYTLSVYPSSFAGFGGSIGSKVCTFDMSAVGRIPHSFWIYRNCLLLSSCEDEFLLLDAHHKNTTRVLVAIPCDVCMIDVVQLHLDRGRSTRIKIWEALKVGITSALEVLDPRSSHDTRVRLTTFPPIFELCQTKGRCMCLCSRLDIKYWSTRNEQIWYVLRCWYVKEVEHDETLIMIVCSWTFYWVGYKQDDWVCNPPFFCWPCNVRWTAQINRLKIKQTAELFVWCDVMTSSPSPLLVWPEDIISQDTFGNVWFDRYEDMDQQVCLCWLSWWTMCLDWVMNMS